MLFVGGIRVPVRLMADGVIIRQARRQQATYHHVELLEHAIILAEGLPAESDLDLGDRAGCRSEDRVSRPIPDVPARFE